MNFLNPILTRIFKVVQYGERIHPVRDWLLLIGVSILIFALSVAYNVFIFVESTKEYTVVTDQAPVSSTLFLEEVRSVFEGRASIEARYRTEQSFIDPS